VTVESLSKNLIVSENTIRRDLSVLEKEGKLRRIQGGAIGISGRSILGKPRSIDPLEAEKKALCLVASRFIVDHKTYIVDAGTSTMMLASYLSKTPMITILSNSLEIINKVSPASSSTLICSGGALVVGLQSFVGKPAEDFFKTVHADYAFIGTKSISDGMLSNENFFEVPVKQRMIEAADHIIILADHTKFGHHGLCDFATLSQIDTIITDWGIEQKYIDEMAAAGVNLLIARPEGSE
jgi:DeoR/GlpR family transcriptional regulator of sugar metabolism